MDPTSKPHSLLSSDRCLNTWLPRNDPSEIVNYILSSETIRSNLKTASVIANLFIARYQKIADQAATTLAGRVKPVSMTLKTFEYFVHFLEQQVSFYQARHPEDLTLEKKWKECLRDLAYLRYMRDHEIKGRVKDFISSLREDLIGNGVSQGDVEWSLLTQIIESPDLLDVDLAVLCKKTCRVAKKSEFLQLNISVEHLQDALDHLLTKLTKDADWVFDEINEQLEPFIEDSEPNLFEYTDVLRTNINEVRAQLANDLGFLNIERMKAIPQLYAQLNTMRAYISKLGGGRECLIEGSFHLGDNNETLRCLKAIHNQVLIEDNQICDDSVIDLDKRMKTIQDNALLLNVLNKNLGKITFGRLKKLITIQEAYYRCHILFDTYISGNITSIYYMIYTLNAWHSEQSHAGKLKKCLKLLQSSKPQQTFQAAKKRAFQLQKNHLTVKKKDIKQITALPDEILLSIFRMLAEETTQWKTLANIKGTCRQFNRLIKDPSILNLFFKKASVPHLGMSAKTASLVVSHTNYQGKGLELDLSACDDLADEDLIQLAQKCPQMVSIKVGGKQPLKHITQAGITALIQSCTNLKHIEFSKCPALDDMAIKQLAIECKGLESIALNDCSALTNQTLISLSTCTSLKKIELMGLNIDDAGLIPLTSNPELKLSHLSFHACPKLINFGLLSIAFNKSLQKLSIVQCGRVNDELLNTLAQYCPNLSTLRIISKVSGNVDISEEGVSALSKGCLKMKTLVITKNESPFLRSIFNSLKGLSNLKKVTLAPYHDEGLAIEEEDRELQIKFPNLRIGKTSEKGGKHAI